MTQSFAKYIHKRLSESQLNGITIEALDDVATMLIGEINHLLVLLIHLEQCITTLENRTGCKPL